MILLMVAQFPMTVAAEDDSRVVVEISSGDMMDLKASPIGLATLRATRVIRPEPLEGVPAALLTSQILIAHPHIFLVAVAFAVVEFVTSHCRSSSLSDDDAVDLLERVLAGGREPVEDIWARFER
jgi:hypothetical protein